MKNGQSVTKRRWYQIVTGILSLVTLGISLLMIRTFMGYVGDDATISAAALQIDYFALRPIAIALFLSVVALHLFQGIATFRESTMLFLKHLIYIVLSGWAIARFYLKGGDPVAWPESCFLYLIAVLIGRLISLIQKRNKWNILLFVFMLIVTFFGGCTVLFAGSSEPGASAMASFLAVTILFMLVDVQGVASIFPLAFSSIRMDILKKIIIKTYAVEILSGIVLLIVAFSFILPAFEPNIPRYGDALWYCFAIVTTIGFGDITATSLIGRVLSVVLGLYGIIVVSLITSIIVNFYGEMKKEESDDDQSPDRKRTDRKKRDRKKRDRKKADRETGSRKRTRQGKEDGEKAGSKTDKHDVIPEVIEL